MKILNKLKTDRKFLLIFFCIIIATYIAPYLTIPGVAIWWFYKKSKFSKRFKIIATSGVCGLFIILMTMGFIAYANDTEPHLSITEPKTLTVNTKDSQITIKGTYDPADRSVWINGQKIKATNGNFETTFKLNDGGNKIDVEAGNWKRTSVYLTVTRELTDKEKDKRITPTIQPTNTSKPTPTLKLIKAIVITNTPVPTNRATPTSKPKKAITPPPTIAFDVNGFPDNAEKVTVSDIAKTPNAYAGYKPVVFTCKILNFARNEQGDAAAVNCSDPNDYSSMVQVDIGNFDIKQINTGDTVVIYGLVMGAAQGKNAFGATVTEAVASGIFINDLTSITFR